MITGPPAAGKTTLARRLAPALGLPLIAKDDLKVILYNTLGWGGREQDQRVSAAAYELMFHVASCQLAAGRSMMLESNFRPSAAARLCSILAGHRDRTIQVCCHASREVLVARLEERAGLQLRHPGHADRETINDLQDLLASGIALPLPGTRLEVDTTDPAQVDAGSLVEMIRRQISSPA